MLELTEKEEKHKAALLLKAREVFRNNVQRRREYEDELDWRMVVVQFEHKHLGTTMFLAGDRTVARKIPGSKGETMIVMFSPRGNAQFILPTTSAPVEWLES